MVVACTRLLPGSGYAGFNGELPALVEQSALASEYAHVTAPLRRLGDRYAGEICVALCAGEEVPDWVLDKLPELPDTLRQSSQRANHYQNAVLDLVEAAVLEDRVGDTFDGVVVEVDGRDGRKGEVSILDPAVEAPVTGSSELPLGTDVRVKLVEANVDSRHVAFALI
jgi:exoribonuclease R